MSPYLAGAGIGVLSWITFAVMGKALGTSTTFVRAAGAAENALAPEHVARNDYLTRLLGTAAQPKPLIDWQFALVAAMLAGAFLAARWSGDRIREVVPPLWQARFGPSRTVRFAGAFFGGVLVLFGARMADGCTSGHSISGGLQLALSSWVFTLTMFGAGLLTASAIFRRGVRHAG